MKKSLWYWFCRIATTLLVVLLIYRCDVLFPSDMDDSANTVKDIDGNEYTTVTIGTQEWMVENLKTTRYNDGALISLKINPLTNYESYCWYNNDITNKKQYGALYDWGAAKSGRLAPSGWHVADYYDWLLLNHFLGENIECKLKETGSVHWISPSNDCATNESGFTALPAGYFTLFGGFEKMGTGTGWFPSSMRNSPSAYPVTFFLHGDGLVNRETRPNEHYSVRCIKNTIPTITTSATSGITASAALSGGEVTIKGGSENTSRGVCWNTAHNPTTINSKTIDEFGLFPAGGGMKMSTFKSTLTGLHPNTTYYLRAYATNSDGTGYGNEVTFKTLP